MKKASLVIIFLSLGLFVLASSQELSQKEKEIYYDFVKIYYDTGSSDEACVEAAVKHRVSMDEVLVIEEKGALRDLKGKEWEVLTELEERFNYLPSSSSKERYNEIFRDVAARYSLSFIEVVEIYYRGVVF